MSITSRLKTSFASRVSAWVIALTGVVFIVSASVTYHYLTEMIEDSSSSNAQLTMDNVVTQIDKRLSGISKSIDNIAMIIENEELTADTLYSVVKYIVANNPEIVGSAIAFEPDYFADKGYYYSPYAYRSEGQILTKQLGNLSYDYFSMEWYYDAKLKGEGNWTDPYVDEGGGEIAMCTYSSVMRDNSGEFIGVVTADISLDWLKDLVGGMRPYPNSYGFALDKSGSYIIHDHYTYSPYNTIFTVAKGEKREEQLVQLGKAMLSGDSGALDITNYDGKSSKAFYTPIPKTGWSLAMVSTKADIFEKAVKSSHLIGIITFLGLLLIFFGTRMAIKRLVRPLHSFAASAQQIAKGDFAAELPAINTKDEMLELHNSLDYMKRELATYVESLATTVASKERIESELRIARSIQMGLVPKSFPPYPLRRDIDIYAILRTAKEVGGDLYDFFIDNNNLYFAIGDVSDKGIPAALFMAVTRSHFRSIAAPLHKPKSIILSLNMLLSENNDENMFVTMIVGVLDLETGHVEYCNAGHNNPCIVDAKGGARFLPMHPSLPIGILPDAEYVGEEFELGVGETLFLYTDGLNEAENKERKRYGDPRLIEKANSDRNPSAKELVKRMEASVDEFVDGAKQSDDITMLAIKYLGCQQETEATKILSLKNDVAEIDHLAQWLEVIYEEQQLDELVRMPLRLAMEEAVINVINYAYPKDGQDYYFSVSFTREPEDVLRFVIEDRGVPFNPLEAKEADITLSAEDRPIGGLGIHLVKQLMTSVEYCHAEGKNKLILKKKV